MSAWLALAAVVAALLLVGTQAKSRTPWIAGLAGGLEQALGGMFAVLLIANIVVSVLAFLLEGQARNIAFSTLEGAIGALEKFRTLAFGPWDWRLAAVIILLGLAGIRFAHEEHARLLILAGRKGAVAAQKFGGVLSVLAALTVFSGTAPSMTGNIELKFTEARGEILAEAKQISDRAMPELRLRAVLAVNDKLREGCAADAPCAPLDRYEAELAKVRDRIWEAQYDPALNAIWAGDFAYGLKDADPPVSAPPLAPFYAELSANKAQTLRRETISEIEGAEEARRGFAQTVEGQIISLAATAGYESAITVAQRAGASGDVVNALLAPLVGDAMSALVEEAINQTLAAILRGDKIADAFEKTFRPRFDEAIATPGGQGALSASTARVDATLANASAQSQPYLERLEAEKREQAAQAQANAEASGGGPTFSGIQPPVTGNLGQPTFNPPIAIVRPPTFEIPTARPPIGRIR